MVFNRRRSSARRRARSTKGRLARRATLFATPVRAPMTASAADAGNCERAIVGVWGGSCEGDRGGMGRAVVRAIVGVWGGSCGEGSGEGGSGVKGGGVSACGWGCLGGWRGHLTRR